MSIRFQHKGVFISWIILILIYQKLYGQPATGQPAYEVALPSLNGDTLRLSSLRGKVVLLDFWASWCRPCRIANKGLAKIYARYKNRGFEIFGVSLDEKKSEWLKAIKKDKITWLQVRDPDVARSVVALQWNITGIPTSYLLDRDGRIVAIDPVGKELEDLLEKMLPNH
ncbi:MAG: TlpA family protein disulfide reductase [Chitinophagaceae bacterium]|nr:TlpA family protein disulfide reductase [Chitinophagaceae bacterium]